MHKPKLYITLLSDVKCITSPSISLPIDFSVPLKYFLIGLFRLFREREIE